MDSSYTAGAYTELKPIEADFGKTAQEGVDAYWKKNALKIQQRKAEQDAIKARQEQTNKNLKDLQSFVEKIPQLDVKNYDAGLTSMMVGQMKEYVANLKRVMLDPDSTAQQKIDAQTSYGEMINQAKGYKSQQESWDDLCSFMGNQENLDTILNSDLLADFADAAYQKESNQWRMDDSGNITNGGSISYKIENGTPKMTINLKRSGKTFTGTQQEVAAWIKSLAQKPVNEQNIWKNAGMNLKPKIYTSEEETENGFIKTVSYIDKSDLDRKAREEFRMLYPKQENINNYPPEIRKTFDLHGASSYQDLEDQYVKSVINRFEANGVQVRTKPKASGGTGGEEGTSENMSDFLTKAQQTFAGNKASAETFKGKSTRLNVEGARGADAKIEDIYRDGDDIVVKVNAQYMFSSDSSGEKGVQSLSQEYRFNSKNEDDLKSLLGELSFSYNSTLPSSKQKINPALINENVDFSQSVWDDGIIRDKITEKLDGLKNGLNSKKSITEENLGELIEDLAEDLSEVGIDIKADHSGVLRWKHPKLVAKDKKTGKEITIELNGDVDKDKFVDQLREEVLSVIPKRDKKGVNPFWIKAPTNTESKKGSNQMTSASDLYN